MGKKRLQAMQRRQTGFVERRFSVIVLVGVILVACVAVYLVATQGWLGGNTNQDTNTSDTTLPNGNETSSTTIRLTTSMGDITIKLYDDMPITSANFRNLTEHGIYDGTVFHRITKENIYVVQGGNAESKGVIVPTIPDELPNTHSNIRGSVAMAKTDQPDSATSQFYVNYRDDAQLDSNYSVFGRVIEGMSMVDAMSKVPTNSEDAPYAPITLIKAEVIG